MMKTLLTVTIAVFMCCIGDKANGHNFSETNWGLKFHSDVLVPSNFQAFAANADTICATHCMASPACRSFAFSSGNKICWLYDHLVEFTTIGTPALGTCYYWRLSSRCPTELGYTLEAGICFNIHTNAVSRSEANTVCQNEGATLYMGKTAASLAMLFARYSQETWIGVSKDAMTGNWFFVDGTRLPIVSNLWEPTQPDNYLGNQHFARLTRPGKLDDMGSDFSCFAACQIPML